MCGICGVINSHPNHPVEESVLREMCRVIYHRGPDDDGYYFDQQAGLGMRRLSIIDLVTGDQPMTNEDHSVHVVYNGEMYNFKSLREKLSAGGHQFKTKSDTEVIVHAYEEYGDQCPQYFNGMFAFALWDASRKRLLLARDHLGIKPLYYWIGKDSLIFGSELKSVIAHPHVPRDFDLPALDQFLTLEYIPTPRTIFQEVKKLPPGSSLVYQDGKATIQQYWDLPRFDAPEDEPEAAEMLTELIDDAVRMQLVSDVPLGAFLSGGIDSSTVVSSMSRAVSSPVKTFSIGFDDATYNELPYARLVAQHFGTEHTEEILEPNIAGVAERLIRHLDEPFGDFSIFPTYLVSQVARQKVKVVLSGDGGDEIFGGYDTYVAQDVHRYYRYLPEELRKKILPSLMDKLPPRPGKKGLINKTKRFVEGAALSEDLQHTRWMQFLTPQEKSELYLPGLNDSLNGHDPADQLVEYFNRMSDRDPLIQQQYVDLKTYLVDDILTKVDRMSMAVSLEARVPLLDYRIVELAVNLPPDMKLQRGQTKRILRLAMGGRLPPEVLHKPKQGFSIPLKNWLQGPLRPMMQDLLAVDRIKRRGYFNPECVSRWVGEHLVGSMNHSHRLWALMVFEMWNEQLMDANVLA